MEAMGTGGELTLRVADLSEGGGTTLLVEVSDTGTGIPEELLAKIFDPFVSTKARGSGLGLAICRGVADAHRARLRARNNSERPGSTFTIEFPVPVVASSPPQRRENSPLGLSRRVTALAPPPRLGRSLGVYRFNR